MDGRALVGRPFDEVPVHKLAAPTTSVAGTGGTCRLVVVGTATCPYCRSLALGWEEDMRRRLREAGVEARATWVVYGDSAGRREMLGRSQWGDVDVREATGGIAEATAAMGISAVPQTFLIDSTGMIRAVMAGNILMPRESLQAVCHLAPVRRE